VKVREFRTKKASFRGPESTEGGLPDAEEQLRFLPVVGEGGNLIEALTGDIGIALGTRNCKPSNVRVWEVMPHTLRGARIRRLPVIDRDGPLVGVSRNDLQRPALVPSRHRPLFVMPKCFWLPG
jgi:hypothetical protein